MAIILRSTKNAPLTIEELDNNFDELSKRMTNIEQGNFAIEGLARIYLEGNEVVFTSSLHREIGRCALPMPALHGRGPWEQKRAYSQGDIVASRGKAFLCAIAHQSQDSQSTDSEKWQLLLDAQDFTSDVADASSLSTHQSASSKAGIAQENATLPLYEAATLPLPHLGKVGVLLEKDRAPKLVFATGHEWQALAASDDTSH